jgi:DNA-binding LytR/AlgR family response regulator
MEAFQIALVDDDPRFRKSLERYLLRSAEEEGCTCTVTVYENSTDFLQHQGIAYDLILLDIEMPGMNGLDLARQIRVTDQQVGIIFVTNMARYALAGYEVNAIDYMVKPVEYDTFRYKFKKALRYCHRNKGAELVLLHEEGMLRIPYREIYYMEKDRNYLIYHTAQGDFRERGTMAEKKVPFLSEGFAECSSGCVVNLRHVSKVVQDSVYVQQQALPISRRQRKPFMDSLMSYLGR